MTSKILFRKTHSAYKRIRLVVYWYLSKIARSWVLCSLVKGSRITLWRATGCKIGKGVYIGWDVYYDVSNANLITLEDDVTITSRALLLCHRRDMSEYYMYERYNDLPYIKKPILIKKGASIGMGAIILPGVTIGEGAIVGAGSVVSKDVPEWCVAAGIPARIVKHIKKRNVHT